MDITSLHFESIGHNFEIGEACSLSNIGGSVYGRMTGALSGSSAAPDGKGGMMHSQLFFTTPGGTTLLTGKAYLCVPKDIDEKIAYHESRAVENGNQPLYDGIIKLINGKWKAAKRPDLDAREEIIFTILEEKLSQSL
jgi:hypothetical protein